MPTCVIFFGWFYLKPKLNRSFPCFCFDIYHKIILKLVLPPGFKVINVKNLHSKNLKRKFRYCIVNVFHFFNFCNCRIPNQQLFLCSIFYLCKKVIKPHIFILIFCSLFGKTYQLHAEVSVEEKKWINHQNLMHEQKQPLKNVFY